MKINEIADDDDLSWVAQAADEIRANCKPFLQQIGNDVKSFPLYRGFNPTTVRSKFTTMQCPQDRKPISSNDRVHDISDLWFYNNFGIRYRSNAIFASGNYYQADAYGTVCAIFPIGEFKFCYSPAIFDLYDAWEDFKVVRHPESELEAAVTNVLTLGKYQTTGLKTAIETGNEIMIHCNTYYRVVAYYRNQMKLILATLQHELEVR